MNRTAIGRTAAAAGVVVLLAIIVVTAAVVVYPRTSPTTQSTNQGGSSTSSSTKSATTSTYGPGTHGTLAVMATDPPVLASGVTRAVVQYNGLAVHEEGSSSINEGWVDFNSTGSIDLTSVVNASETIAVANLSAGSYNMVRLDVTSATVTYNGRNYTAAVRSGELAVHMTDTVRVNSTVSSATLVDIRTFVINWGNSTSPQFFLSASATATPVPSSDVTQSTLRVGARLNLSDRAWFRSFESRTSVSLAISNVTLTTNSLSLKLENAGNNTANVKTVIVTPMQNAGSVRTDLPPSMAGSAVFTVGSSGSLQASSTTYLQSVFSIAGLNVTSESSTALSFAGSISLDLGLGLGMNTGVVSGQQYLVTVIGDNAFSSTTVVAG